MKQPIIVTGGPRSGTTLTMRILHAAGMQIGKGAEQSELREGKVRDYLYKPILEEGGFDPLAQDPLPPVGWYPDMYAKEFRERVLELVEVDDFNKPWGFKAIKGVLFWRLLHDAFPDAEWVFVDRPVDEHIASLMRTPFMTAYRTYGGWRSYLKEIEWHIEDAMDNVSGHSFLPCAIRDGDWEEAELLIKRLGLNLNDNVYKQYNPTLYRA